jgi:hypothetical protein
MQLDLYIDIQNRILVKGLKDTASASLPAFYQGSSVNLRVKLLTPNSTGGFSAPFTEVDISTTALHVGIGDPAGASEPVAETATFVYNGTTNFLEGTLNLDTVALDAYIGSEREINTYFEVNAGNPADKVVQAQVSLRATLLDPSGPKVPAPAPSLRKGTDGYWYIADDAVAGPNNFRKIGCTGGSLTTGDAGAFPG